MGKLLLGLLIVGTPFAAAAQTLKPYEAPHPVQNLGQALPVEWRTGEAALPNGALQLSLKGRMEGADGYPVLRPDDEAEFRSKGFDLTVTPEPVQVGDFDITPHAGVIVSDGGRGAKAGATMSLRDKVEGRLDGMVRDGRSFGDRGRFYLYAAAEGRSVGMNVLRGESGYERAGWSTDGASGLIAEAQAGVGWRRGPLMASVGYQRREFKTRHDIPGIDHEDDDLVAVSFSFKPR